ncbi:NAD(P)H-quinone oxidoreductase subunit 6 [Striga asiatica]|uniref:NAD(P)H-quinone oxidoreductase subunit 6 n=1 Tax=Striga asiatica TaxID=4170 RepID=A0A5A7PB58_STRAF|nr:NAD(P)H-quinone oxidoreductase subunit 6 [Striga asiatica]
MKDKRVSHVSRDMHLWNLGLFVKNRRAIICCSCRIFCCLLGEQSTRPDPSWTSRLSMPKLTAPKASKPATSPLHTRGWRRPHIASRPQQPTASRRSTPHCQP